MQWETTYKTTPNQNKLKLYTIANIEHGLKIMPRSYRGHRSILCIIDEVINYLITVPIHQAKSEVGETLIENVIKILCSRLHNHGSR